MLKKKYTVFPPHRFNHTNTLQVLSCDDDLIQVMVKRYEENPRLFRNGIFFYKVLFEEEEAEQRFLEIVNTCPRITTFTFGQYEQSFHLPSLLPSFTSQCRHITRIIFDCKIDLTEETIDPFIESLETNTTLLYLAFLDVGLHWKSVDKIGTMLALNTHLQTFILKKQLVGSESLNRIVNALAFNTSLTALHVGHTTGHWNPNQLFYEGLFADHNLVKLKLDGLCLQLMRTHSVFGKLVSSNSKLQKLSLANINLGRGFALGIIEALPHNNTLSTLSIKNCFLDNEIMNTIIDFLISLEGRPALQNIKFLCTYTLQPHTLKNMVRLVAANKEMRSIIMNSINLDRVNKEKLGRALELNPYLEHFSDMREISRSPYDYLFVEHTERNSWNRARREETLARRALRLFLPKKRSDRAIKLHRTQ